MRARDRAALAVLAMAALALRLAFRIDHDEDIDALRFRLGVERFSVAELRPHAPFYPVFIGAAKLVAWLGASPRGALAIVSATSGAAVVALTALLAFEVLGRRGAWMAGALALGSPFLWLSSQKLLSDATGLAFVTAGLWLCARARRLGGDRAAALRTAALVVLGVGLGARLSYFPVALACAAVIAREEGGHAQGGRAWLARARDLATGAALWLVPLVIAGGARALVSVSAFSAKGHFTEWGGSAITVSSPWERIRGIAWGLWANVLGGPWPDAPRKRFVVGPLLMLLLAAALERARPRAWLRAQPEIAISVVAYSVWAALGQNVAYKPRHLLPLLPLAILALAAGALAIERRVADESFELKRSAASARRWLAPGLVAALSAAWLANGATLAWAHRALSPAAATVAFLAAGGGGARPVVSRELARMIAEGAPGRAITFAADDRAIADAAIAAGPDGVLLTSEAMGPRTRSALSKRGVDVRVIFSWPRSRYVDSLWDKLSLVEAKRRTPHNRY